MGRAFIGTSGWMYRHWANGVFYPPRLRQIDWLEYYAGQFPTVEINASYYRLPSEEAVAHWRKVAPKGFLFAVKCWRRITHLRRLKPTCWDDLEIFLQRIKPLGNHLGPLLVQLPPSMKADLDLLEAFLKMLPKRLGKTPLRVALEVRHPSWLTDETRNLLDRFAVSLVIADWHKCNVTETNDAPFVYIRRHGAAGPYAGCYTDSHLKADAEMIVRFLKQPRDVYVYFNNDVHGYAVQNARRLTELLQERL